jgi:hypothetical protein
MRSLLIFAFAIALLVGARFLFSDYPLVALAAIGAGLLAFVFGAIVNHGEHTRR